MFEEGEGRPWRGVWEVSEGEPFRGLLQQTEWSLSPPPSFPHMEAILGGPVGVESLHTTRTLLRCCQACERGQPIWESGVPVSCPWVGKIPWRRKMATDSSILTWKSSGQRRLAGYSPKGHREWDRTEWLHTHERSVSCKVKHVLKCITWPSHV